MNRKATFAKRQREMDLKDHARSKQARSDARKENNAARQGKGPEIAWDEMVYPTAPNPEDDAPQTSTVFPKKADGSHDEEAAQANAEAAANPAPAPAAAAPSAPPSSASTGSSGSSAAPSTPTAKPDRAAGSKPAR